MRLTFYSGNSVPELSGVTHGPQPVRVGQWTSGRRHATQNQPSERKRPTILLNICLNYRSLHYRTAQCSLCDNWLGDLIYTHFTSIHFPLHLQRVCYSEWACVAYFSYTSILYIRVDCYRVTLLIFHYTLWPNPNKINTNQPMVSQLKILGYCSVFTRAMTYYVINM